MPINPLIPLSGSSINTLPGVQTLARGVTANRELRRREGVDATNKDLADQQISQARMQETAMFAVGIQPLVDAAARGDEAAQKALEQQFITRNTEVGARIQNGERIDNTDTNAALDLVQAGDFAGLKAEVDKLVTGAERGGLIKPAAGGEADFTLGPGQQRFTAEGIPLASVDPKSDVASDEAFAQQKELVSLRAEVSAKIASTGPLAKLQFEVASLQKQKLEGDITQQEFEIEANKLEVQENELKDQIRAQGREAKANIVEGKIAEAQALVDQWMTTGFAGTVLQFVGGTDARNLRGTIDTIQAILGFEELNAMRAASKTGGALGAIAVRELDLLQATVASLDQGADDATLTRNLQQVGKHIQNWKIAVDSAYAAKQKPPAEGASVNVPQDSQPPVRQSNF